jgi:hypothetical protein
MLGFIAVPVFVMLLLVLFFFAKKRRGRNRGRHADDLGPVSGQWLADRRRSG